MTPKKDRQHESQPVSTVYRFLCLLLLFLTRVEDGTDGYAGLSRVDLARVREEREGDELLSHQQQQTRNPNSGITTARHSPMVAARIMPQKWDNSCNKTNHTSNTIHVKMH